MLIKKIAEKIDQEISTVLFNRTAKILITVTFFLLPLCLLEKSGLLFFIFHYNPFSKDVYFWYFSTIIQSLSALFGIGGMFAAYLLQIANNRLKDAYQEAKLITRYVPNLSETNDEKYIALLEEYIQFPDKYNLRKDELDEVRNAKEEIDPKANYKHLISGSFKNLILFMVSVLVLSIIALPLSNYFPRSTFGFIFLIFHLLLIIIFISKLVSFTFAAIRS